MKKWVIAGIGALVAFILIGVFSIYFIVGIANRATYKRQTQDLVVETFAALKKTKSGGPHQSLLAFEQLQKNSKKAADQLAGRPVPNGAEQLKTDAVQVVDIAGNIADRGILMFDYIDKINNGVNRWAEDVKSVNTVSDPTVKLQKLQSVTNQAATELKGLRPPTSLVNFHLQLTDLLGTMTANLGDMVAASKANDAGKLQILSNEWQTLAARIDKLSKTIGSDVANDIMTPSDQRKLDRLAKEIDSF